MFVTSSLVPIELYELYRYFSVVKVGVLVVNPAIVAYLVYHIRTQPRRS